METTTGLYNYTVDQEFGIASAHSDITDSILFFTVDGRWFRPVR
jgi:hypothetical protein